MRHFLSLVFISLFGILNTQGQEPHRCHSDDVHDIRYASDADYRHDFDVRKAELDELMEMSNVQGRMDCDAPIVIPVAVHYIGVTNQSTSCLTDLALSQVAMMNEDFSATNGRVENYYTDIQGTTLTASQIAGDGTCIQFCLADANHPGGFGLEDGDYAITINQDYYDDYGDAYTSSQWSGYLNMIVTNNIMNQGVLGFTYLFQPADGSGVVVSSCVFGDVNFGCGGGFGSGAGGTCSYDPENGLGKTATHEVGHFLGLPHPWGANDQEGDAIGCSSDDGIADTPTSDGPYFGCPVTPSSCGTDDMYMNFMDYADDICSYMFSVGQTNVMYNRASQLWSTTSVKCSSTTTENDASILNFIYPLNTVCGTTVAPIVTLENVGSLELTTVDIEYSVSGGGSNTFSWTGSLMENETEVVYLPEIPSSSSNYTLMVATNNPNGVTDENPMNDSKDKQLTVVEGVGLPFTEDVEDFSQPFPAQGIIIDNPDNDNYAWDRRPGASANGNGVYSIYFNNFEVNTDGLGKEDWFILPEMDATGFNSVDLSFDLAYTYYSSGAEVREDELKIMYSLGCSNEWQEIWSDSGASLATASPSTSLYLPNPQSDWENKMMGINTEGFNFIRIAFVNISGRGNNLFLDNINIQGSMSIVSNENISSLDYLNISPNPSKGWLNLDISFSQIEDYSIVIHDAVGRMSYSQNHSGNRLNESMDISQLSNGVYFISIRTGSESITRKFILAQ